MLFHTFVWLPSRPPFTNTVQFSPVAQSCPTLCDSSQIQAGANQGLKHTDPSMQNKQILHASPGDFIIQMNLTRTLLAAVLLTVHGDPGPAGEPWPPALWPAQPFSSSPLSVLFRPPWTGRRFVSCPRCACISPPSEPSEHLWSGGRTCQLT